MDHRLARLGVTHVLTFDRATAARYAATGRFTEVSSAGDVSLLRVAAPPGELDPSTLLSAPATSPPVVASLPTGGPEHLRWTITTPQAVEVSVALGWSPKWHARIDGHSLRIDATR